MTKHDDRPSYDRVDGGMLAKRAAHGERFAAQIAATCGSLLPRPLTACDVADVGCGYGYTARALAKSANSVVGFEPSAYLADHAASLAAAEPALRFLVHHAGWEGLSDHQAAFDLVILDNVLEHIADQRQALSAIWRSLRPGGLLFLVVPNRLWPIEHHYHLLGLGWLPLPIANRYLQISGRGTDYTDASYAPTPWTMARLLAESGQWDWRYTLPADISLTQTGATPVTRLGVALLQRYPVLWGISKALLVVAHKPPVSVTR